MPLPPIPIYMEVDYSMKDDQPPAPMPIYEEVDYSMKDDQPPAPMPIYDQVDDSFDVYIKDDQCHNPGYGLWPEEEYNLITL